MIKSFISSSAYIQFNRKEWTILQKSVPIFLTKTEILNLREINESLSIKEVIETYLPLSYLINFYINSSFNHKLVLNKFLGINRQKVPYIIGITGSVAAGKSTISRILQVLLSLWPEHYAVELVTTDGFLYSNKILKDKNLMQKKGFPQSYDTNALLEFMFKVRSGELKVKAPIYSHLVYDIIPDKYKVVSQPDILILEGLNVLQSNINQQNNSNNFFISDFIDFSIYVDSPEIFLKKWYVDRFLRFCRYTFSDPSSYFHNYTQLPKYELIRIANKIWIKINRLNLQKHILPTRERANLILSKNINHSIETVQLRK